MEYLAKVPTSAYVPAFAAIGKAVLGNLGMYGAKKMANAFSAPVVPKLPRNMFLRRKRKRYGGRKSSRGRIRKKVKCRSKSKYDYSRAKRMPTTYIYRGRTVVQYGTNLNEVTYNRAGFNEKSALDGMLQFARAYNPSSPGTPITVDLSTGDISRNIYIQTSKVMRIRNNGRTPVFVTMEFWRAVKDGNTTIDDWYLHGVQNGSNGAVTSVNLYPSDFEEVWYGFKRVMKKKRKLGPGREIKLKISCPWFNYQPAAANDTALTVLTKYYCGYQHTRIEGVISHDGTTTGNVGTIGSIVDVMSDTQYKVKYDGGYEGKYIYVQNASQAQTAGPVVSVPAAGNYVLTAGAANS